MEASGKLSGEISGQTAFEESPAWKTPEPLGTPEPLNAPGASAIPGTSSTSRIPSVSEPLGTLDASEEAYLPLETPVRDFDIPKSPRFHLSLALGIVFIVIALVIAVFLVYKYVNASRHNLEINVAAGMNLEGVNDMVAVDASIGDLQINWDALQTINPDIVGWVMIPGTVINYPIVQGSDNVFYLNHLSDKTPSDTGAIFLDSENDPAIAGWNNIIYGHNLLDGSMFASLKSYNDEGYFNEHRTVLLATPAKNYQLRVDAALVCNADDKIRRFGFTDRGDYENYVRMLLGYAVHSEIPQDAIPENIYCFVTCTDTNYSKRTMIMATVVEAR
jgi:sortase B